ncbi:LytTR family DNA-binding domain-containing protein [Niveispirillum sp. KHB5.9]|uniref:LytTR family DNA-binding domain-containing protein n=1 Tax=Niveispirillum sp. KHB5.9 TaxID=3400269 RepID=UPI003A8542FE
MPGTLQRIWAELGLSVLLALALAVMGPFGTFERGVLLSMGYWISVTACWTGLAALARAIILRHRPGLGRLPTLGLRVLLTTIPMMLVVTLANQAMGFDWQPTPDELAGLFGQILLVGSGLTFLTDTLLDGFAARVSVPAPVSAEPPPTPAGDGLQEKLPASIRGPVLCLEMEDHYVRVHTAQGSALVLMRMTDAVAQAPEGLRVHRSWWVAADAVRQVARRGRTVQLDLGNGLSVPVSQPYLKAVTDRFGPPMGSP